MNAEQVIRENARRNAAKKQDYDPISGLNCCGERFVLTVKDKHPRTFYLPIEMEHHPAVLLLKKHESVAGAVREVFGKRSKVTDTQCDYFWLKVCEERYKYDFEFFAVGTETIIDKLSAQPVRFVLNPPQRMALKEFEEDRHAGRQILAQILKAKQMGFSTLVEMYMKWIQIIHRINWNSVICAHDLTAARNIRSMYGDSVKEMPPIAGEKITLDSFESTQNIKLITKTGCRITVGTALKPESIRSQNIKMVHFSEMAFYPHTDNNNPELVEASVISSLTDGPYTMIVRESTANGVGDYFHEQWLKAKRQETAFKAIFAPWFMMPIYEIPLSGQYYQHNGRQRKGTVSDFIATLNDYEKNLFGNHKLCTLENLNWRRMKAATMPSESKMKQEYPSDDIEAFQDSGSPVFRSEDIEAMRADCCLPEVVGTLVSKCSPELAVLHPHRRSEILQDVRFVADAEATDAVINGDKKLKKAKALNKLQVWSAPDTDSKITHRYLVVFDPQKGTSEGADYGVIKVIDRYWMMHGENPEVVALFYGHIDKDITIWIAAQIAKWYNNALLVIESNTYDSDNKEDDSEFIFDILKDYYTNLYSRTTADKIREGAPIKYGFNTNKRTKPMIIAFFKGIIREKGYVERDEETLDEARTYEEKPDGTTGAKAKNHDDRIMATMIGIYVCYEEMPIPSKIKPMAQSHTGGQFIY